MWRRIALILSSGPNAPEGKAVIMRCPGAIVDIPSPSSIAPSNCYAMHNKFARSVGYVVNKMFKNI
jgi:hypothetical protein